MITPLNCVSLLIEKVKSNSDVESDDARSLNIINATIKLLLAAAKENLDSTMLRVDKFVVKPIRAKLVE